MEKKPFTIVLDNYNKQKNNLYQKKIILPKKYKPNSNSFKKIKSNIISNPNMFNKHPNNKNKINSYNIKEIKVSKEPKDSIRKTNIKNYKNKYYNDIKNTNSIIFIQKVFRGYLQRKKLKNNKSRIYLIQPNNPKYSQNKIKSTNIFDAIKRNSKNQKEKIQLNNNRFNNRITMSPKNNIKVNLIYKKNLMLLKKEAIRKKNYSFDYKTKEINVKANEAIDPYKAKNKNLVVNINKNKKNRIKGHLRINSGDNINKNDINIKTNPNNYITFNNKNIKNINNKSLLSSKQTKENSNTNSNINSTNKSNMESPKVNIVNNNNINKDKIKVKQDFNKIKNINKNKANKKENVVNIINEPYKTQNGFENSLKGKIGSEEKKSKNFNLINKNNKFNFDPLIKIPENNKKDETNKRVLSMDFDMAKFQENNQMNFFESIKEDNENDTDLKSSFYDDEEFVIINYDYTLNDKKKALKVSRVENINIDGYLRRKLDFIKFIKKGIYTHAIKYVFNLMKNINKKKIEMDKTMTDNGNASFIQQERIEQNNNIFNKAQLDIISFS